jgi:lysyl-tRNA synthetase class I
MDKFPERFTITSDFSELEDQELDGSRVSVGFRPSGELHVGNLLTLAYSVVVAERLDLELDLFCCDTDWSAHIHEQNRPDNNRVMKLFFQRDCGCDQHNNVAEHRMDEISEFLEGLREASNQDFDARYLTELAGDSGYVSALENLLDSMDEFDEIFGGGFRRRYRSPVVTVCDECGFSHAKGSSYSSETRELVSPCRNIECSKGFMRGKLDGKIGVYYLVDPVRDPSRDVAVHVFGGDYRDAKKEQKTSKVEKVAKITELATGETPAYFLGPMISNEDGKPLSKSKNTGKTVSEIDDLKSYGKNLYRKVDEWIEDERKYLPASDL